MIINLDPQFVEASKTLEEAVHFQDKNSILNDASLRHDDVRGIVVRLGVILNEEFLYHFSNLEFVATITTGTDHIDEKYCKQKNIKVISLKGETEFLKNIHATPEHTWGLLLSLIRRIPWSFESVCAGEWRREDYFGRELYKKTLGIIGFGRIGKILAKYANAFGMNVLAFDRNIVEQNDVNQVDLDVLLKESDVVSIHLPLNRDTEKFMSKDQFQLMKKTAVLINTARGSILDEDALLSALELKQIAGAALDVMTNEATSGVVPPNHPLVKFAKNHQTLLISPHTAGSTYESMERTAFFIAEKIKGALNDQRVSKSHG